jgi:hypothetical protein
VRTTRRPTSLVDINDRGQILGVYAGDDGVLHNSLLDRGRYTSFDAPGVPITLARSLVYGLNDRGQIVGVYENTAATPSPQATGMAPLRLMRQGDLTAVVSDTPEDL